MRPADGDERAVRPLAEDVRARRLGAEQKLLDRPAADDVLFPDPDALRRRDVAVPDAFGVHDDDGAVAALAEAAGLVDAVRLLHPGGAQAVLHGLVHGLGAERGAGLVVDADEGMPLEAGVGWVGHRVGHAAGYRGTWLQGSPSR